MKAQIEFNNVGDDQKYLNFWNWNNGDDVCCEIKDGKLFLMKYVSESEDFEYEEISFMEFIKMVEEKIKEFK